MKKTDYSKFGIGDSFTYKGYTIKIAQDDDPESPRKWDNLGTILYTSSRYVLGDKRVYREEIAEVVSDPNNIVLPVYAYIHSGTRLSTTPFHCPWDSGQCGIIYCTKETAKAEGLTEERAKAVLKGEIETLDQYFNGKVAGITIEFEGEEVDSCWGFYPDDKGYTYGIEDMLHTVRYERKKRAQALRAQRQQRFEHLALL